MPARQTAKPRRKAKRVTVAKAIDISASDSSIFAGTLADTNRKSMPDAEQYWLLFKKQPWVRACGRLIGNAVCQEGYDLGPVEGDDLLDEDNNPNVGLIHDFMRVGFIGQSNTFRKWLKSTAIDLGVIYGWAFTRKKFGAGTLVGLERLDPRLIVPKLNPEKTAIAEFQVRNQGDQVDSDIARAAGEITPSPGVAYTLKPEEVIMFSLDEGGDTVLGAPSPLEALDLTCAMDLNVRQHRNSFFRNGAQLGNAFINKEGAEDQVLAAEKQLMALKVGVRNAFKNVLLTGDWDIKALQQQGKNELDFIKGSDLVRDEICAVFSVPPGKLVYSNNSLGSSGKSEDDDTFEEDCVLPLEENIYETLTSELLQKEFEISDIRFLPKRRSRMRLERIDAAAKLVTFGGTGNEARDLIGLPKIDDPKYDMDSPLFISHTGLNVADDEPAKQPTANSGAIDDAVDGAQDEVAAKAKTRFRHY